MGTPLRNLVKQEVGMQLDPQLAALDRQSRSAGLQSSALSARVGDYYKKLAEDAAGSLARTQALSARVRGEQAGVTDRAQQSIQDAQTAAQSAQQADTQLRGQGLGGGGAEQLQRELAAQRANVAASGAAGEGAASTIGASNEALMNALSATTAARGGEVQGQLATRAANAQYELAQKRADLAGQRGGLFASTLAKERQQAFDNIAAMKTLGLKAADLAAQTANQSANRKLARSRIRQTEIHNRNLKMQSDRQFNLDKQKFGAAQAKDRYLKRHGLGSYKTGSGAGGKVPSAFTPTQVRTNHGKLDNAMSFARTEISAGNLKKGGVQKFASLYAQSKGGDPLLWRVAADLALNGDVDPKYAQQFLNRYGVRVRFRKPKKPKLTTGKGTGGGVGQFGPGQFGVA